MRQTSKVAIAAVSIAVLVASPALAGAKLQSEVLGNTIQLNRNCSGTIIHSDRDDKTGDVSTYVLTAKHCVDGAGAKDMVIDVPVYQDNRMVKRISYVGKVDRVSWSSDLALIKLIDDQTFFESAAAVAGDDVDVAMGDAVVVAGYPAGMGLTLTRGDFVALETMDWPSKGTDYYRATAPIMGGSSGGALYHVEPGGKYELIGVVTGGLNGAPFMGLYTPAPDIYDFLKYALPEAVGAVKPVYTATK